MRIDKTNGKIINTKEVSMHDDIILSFCYDQLKKELILKLDDGWIDYIYETRFVNVIGFEMTSCDYWGPSLRILDFEYMEKHEQILIPKLFEKGRNISDGLLSLKKEDDYIECVITFTSGDTLIIACEYIEYMKDKSNLE